MKSYIGVVCVLSVFIALNCAAPAGQQTSNQEGSGGFSAGLGFNTTALVSTVNQKIQLLRRFCPQLFQVIDNVVQNVTSQVFSIVGRVILRNGLGGGSGSGSGENRVSVVLPTFPPDEEDYDEDEDDEADNKVNSALMESTTNENLDIRIIDSRTRTSMKTEPANEIALNANEIETEGAPFTVTKNVESRIGENMANQNVFDLFDDDCDGTDQPKRIENKITNTNTDFISNIDISNRNSFVNQLAVTNIVTTTENEIIDNTTTNPDNNLNPAIDEFNSNSIGALFKGLIEDRNNEDSKIETENAETTTIINLDAEVIEENAAEASITTDNVIKFDIKVVHNGSVINTIPLIGENTIKELDNIIDKRSPATDIARLKRRVREAEQDQDTAASGGNGPDPADLADVEAEDSERDKRYLPFGGEAHVSAGGGSGNFLFDIIRQTADGAARAVGTVYRMVAGTENIGIGLSASSSSTRVIDASSVPQLIAGSGATEESDEKENGAGTGGVAEIDLTKSADGYTEGIPGPITRLFVIANRGLANLVQDLILRLAQTSERIVNFKARLITALI